MINHANLPLRSLPGYDRIFATAPQHHAHHALELRQSNYNYGCNIILWDRLFGTYCGDETVGQIGAGTGMMAELARLTLTYSGDSGLAPKTLVAKFSSQNPTNREISMSYNLYERETRFFQEVAPNIQTTTPAVYFAGFKFHKRMVKVA